MVTSRMLTSKNLTIVTIVCFIVCRSNVTEGDDAISFNSDIRPILSEYCFACHGPDEHDRAAGLRLDLREPAIEHGALVEGRPEESLLIERIYSKDSDSVMPPPKTRKSLSADQKKLLAEWIRQGSRYENHWSFEPLPETVSVPDAGGEWNRTSLDAFVAATHKKRGLRPGVEAGKATWLRRVTYDLTGLPPTLAELDAFVKDDSKTAYETVVNRLLSSSAYGERMAVMWLDVARYADTFGYQNDVAMEVWPWRDWVIKAFNNNMPYDQFVTEQLAGDLLANATDSQKLATAFNRLHRQTNEGGSVAEEFRLAGITDRTTTAGTAFLGLTMECSRCHDHKFDPIKQKEFYQLSAYFSDIDELGLYSHFTFSAPTPALMLYQGDQRQRHEAATAAVKAAELKLQAAMDAARTKWSKSPNALPSELPVPREPVFAAPLEGDVEGVVKRASVCDGDKSIEFKKAPLFGRTSSFSYSLWVRPKTHGPRMLVLHQSRAAEDAAFRGLSLTLDNGVPQFSMIHFWPGNALRLRAQKAIPTDEWTHLAVTHDGSGRAEGVQLFVDGRAVETEVIRDKLTRDIRQRIEWGDLDVDKVSLAVGARFRDVGFRGGSVDDLKVFDIQLTSAEILSIYAAVRSGVPRNIGSEMALQHQLLAVDSNVAEARERLAKSRKAENDVVVGIREIMTMRHYKDAPATHVLGRGEYTNKGEEVTATTPRLLGALPQADGDRLSLAKWVTDPKNPLTSRVITNRLWHMFFGRGIVVTLEDFGSQGTPPTHPALLNYLARSLIDNDWDLQWLCREIVLSATYRQSSIADATVFERDPDNIWLTRGPKHRLSAEQLRDTVLAASGLMVRTVGGPSVMPYQPPNLWRESGTGKVYKQSTGDGLYRRSLYTFWKRTAPPPSMLTLDATSRESCTPRRELTTTPLQALVFLNDPQYVEASRVLAETLIEKHDRDLESRWKELFRRLTARLPRPEELDVLQQMHKEQRQYFKANAAETNQFLKVGTRPPNDRFDPAELAATTVVVQAMFAFDETIMLR